MRFLFSVCVLTLCGSDARAFADDKAQTKNPPPAPPVRRNANPKVPKLPPPDPVEQLKQFQKLTPEQREKELAKLPPKRRENLEKQLARFDAMTPVQRDRAIHKLELMQTLTPERKQAVNEAIKGLHERFDGLPPRERRQGLAKELYADDMKQKWSPTELELLHGAFPNI